MSSAENTFNLDRMLLDGEGLVDQFLTNKPKCFAARRFIDTFELATRKTAPRDAEAYGGITREGHLIAVRARRREPSSCSFALAHISNHEAVVTTVLKPGDGLQMDRAPKKVTSLLTEVDFTVVPGHSQEAAKDRIAHLLGRQTLEVYSSHTRHDLIRNPNEPDEFMPFGTLGKLPVLLMEPLFSRVRALS